MKVCNSLQSGYLCANVSPIVMNMWIFSILVKATLFISKLEGGVETEFGKKSTDIFELSNAFANKIMVHAVHQQ